MRAAAEERIVRLLDEDADLAERLAPARRELAREELLARMVTLPPGTRAEEALPGSASPYRGTAPHSLMLLDGLVSRTVRLSDTATVQLLGAGDLLEAPGGFPGAGLVPVAIGWTVLEPTRVVLLDEALAQRVRRWPEVLTALLDRSATQSLRLGTHCAISSLPRVEDRIETLLWFLAERWGRVGSHGVVLPLRLTHETLGQMLGAKRPTVSLALKQLAADGLVERRGDGAWLLHREWQDAPVAVEQPGGGVRLVALERTTVDPAAAGDGRNGRGPRNGRNGRNGRTGRTGREELAPAPSPLPYADSSQLQARIERMGAVHARMRDRVRSNLDAATVIREHSIELRARVQAEKIAAASSSQRVAGSPRPAASSTRRVAGSPPPADEAPTQAPAPAPVP